MHPHQIHFSHVISSLPNIRLYATTSMYKAEYHQQAATQTNTTKQLEKHVLLSQLNNTAKNKICKLNHQYPFHSYNQKNEESKTCLQACLDSQ